MAAPPITDPAVAAVFAGYPEALRARLLDLRALIFEAASGDLTESLKWGEPAWRPVATKSGTTVRINAVKGSATDYALYVPCQTSLIATFRDLYGDQLTFEGNRAIRLSLAEPTPREALAHCIALALTYRGRR